MHLEGAKVRSYHRNAGERRVAIALLLAFAALFATANPVQAETELWSATLNIAEPDAESGPEGYCSVAWASAFLRPTWCPYGSLTGTDGGSFEFDGTTYTVEILRYDAGIRDDNSVRLVISPATLFSLHSRTQNWRLHIGSKTFSLSEAHRGTQVGADFTTVRHWWEVTDDDSGRPWPEPGMGSTVAVKLVDVSASLSALTLKDASDGSAIAFTPSFTSDTEEYTATVAHGVDYVELAATTSHDQATVEYLGASGNAYYDRNGRTDALDSRLLIGSNTYRVKVTAEDNVTTKTYTLVVTRRDRLKGWFSGLPDSHDGSTPFTVNLGFPEAIDSPLANVSAAVAVENGTMSNFSARDGSARKYRMTVTPSSAGPLRIRVRAARDCNESHSICSTSGKQFAREMGRWVSTADDARLRALWLTLGLDGSWPLALGEDAAGKGATVTPRLALGLRHDGGDAETGYGVDIASGIDLALPEHGLTASLSGRGLLTHEATGLRDRGIAGTLAWTPRSSGRGPSLSLSQTFGAGASSGKNALLTRETLEGLAANPGPESGAGGNEFEQRRLEAKFGYGFAMFGDRFTATPEIALGLWQAGRDYSLGWRMVNAGRGIGSLELSLEATRRESANDDAPPEHSIGFRLTARW